MSDFFRANFIGTAGQLLSTYTPEVGLPISNDLGGDPLLTAHNSIRFNSAAEGFSRFQDVPPNANYAIQLVATFNTVVNDQLLQLGLRCVTGAGSPRIAMIYDGSNAGGSVLYIADESTGFSVIAGPISFVPTVGGVYTFLYQVSGTTFTVFVNGSQVLQGTTSSLPGTGHALINFQGASTETTGLQISQLRCFPTGSPSPSLSIVANDSHILYDPIGWNINGTRALSVNAGSHFRFSFSNSTYVRAYFDTSNYGSDTMALAWRIDQGVWSTTNLAHGTDHIDFATGLSVTRKQLNLQIMAMPQTDSWSGTPVDAIIITGFEIDLFGQLEALTDIRPLRGISNGDSITRQSHAGPGDTDDSRYTYPSTLWDAFNAEWSNHSFGSSGWLQPFFNGGPSFFTPGNDALSWWNKTITGVPITFTNIDFITVFLGSNDGGQTSAAVSASVAGWLTAQRAACPAAKIFVIVPFFASAAGVTAGFNAYQSASPDSSVFLINLGAIGALGVTSYPTASYYSVDGLHFDDRKHAQFSAMVAQALQLNLGGGVTPPPTPASGSSANEIVYNIWLAANSFYSGPPPLYGESMGGLLRSSASILESISYLPPAKQTTAINAIVAYLMEIYS